MPRVKIDYIVSFSSEDSENPASNLLAHEVSKKKWLCNAGEPSCSVVLQLARAVQISTIHIGAHHAALVEVLVGRSETPNDQFEVLVPSSVFLSPMDSRRGAGAGAERVRSFSAELLAPARAQRWDRVRVVCSQPYNKHCKYGLSFIHIFEAEERPAEAAPAPAVPGRLTAPAPASYSSDEDEFRPGELFAKHMQRTSEAGTKNTEAQIRQASSQALRNITDSATKLVKTPLSKNQGNRPGQGGDFNADRQRDTLMYDDDDERPHAKIDSIVQRHKDEREKDTKKKEAVQNLFKRDKQANRLELASKNFKEFLDSKDDRQDFNSRSKDSSGDNDKRVKDSSTSKNNSSDNDRKNKDNQNNSRNKDSSRDNDKRNKDILNNSRTKDSSRDNETRKKDNLDNSRSKDTSRDSDRRNKDNLNNSTSMNNFRDNDRKNKDDEKTSQSRTKGDRESNGERDNRKRQHSDDRQKAKEVPRAGPVSSSPHTLLLGVVFALSGYENPRRGRLRDVAVAMGARFERDWSAACTHLICAFPNTPKLRTVRSSPQGGGCVAVRGEWLEQCSSKRRLLPWQWFATEPSKQVSPPSSWEDDDTASECDTDDEIEKVLRKQKKQRTDKSPPRAQSKDKPQPHSSKDMSPHSSRERSPRPQTSKERSPKQQTSKEKSPRPQISRERSPRPQTSEERSPKQQTSNEKSPRPQISKETKQSKRNSNCLNMSSDSDVAFVKDERIQANITIDSGDSTDEEKPVKREKIDKSKALPVFFDGYTFVIDEGVEEAGFDRELLARYVKAYGGVVIDPSQLDSDSEANYVLCAGAGEGRGLRVRADWVWRCHRDKRLCDVSEYAL